MCECHSVGSFFVCPNSFLDIFSQNYDVKNSFPNYILESIPCEKAQPEFDYGEFYYACVECQQPWYFECYPDTPTNPIFGIKLIDIKQTLSQNQINSIKQFLVVLAHEGFSENKCIHKGCMDYSLKGIKVCLNHFGYKFCAH
ncbi:hypothetical protein BEN71_17715 [Acinetobacter wuhouensis]|uniref:hypothetical protein n=1 Tax=Acinetobacter TaxID=469 RepID=UPI000839FAC4|nr:MULTISPECIES: hypothetical protein [Acinetobacter]AXQ23789.1 hypothetical protein BEN71_17715 [Acinetobacter wuhouensis]RZG71135.1 hypothetical protein EXU29_15365 [Acinetobacter wuhouensis]RZG78261.1 hypothetical protein EXE09_01480 [Acinetobacter sp. WCHAc060025]